MSRMESMKEKTVYELCEELADILTADYIKWSSNREFPAGSRFFEVVPRRNKYIKIIFSKDNGRSMHAFVEESTGLVYKPASWNAPAKGPRYDIRRDIARLAEIADWAGSYLYKR